MPRKLAAAKPPNPSKFLSFGSVQRLSRWQICQTEERLARQTAEIQTSWGVSG